MRKLFLFLIFVIIFSQIASANVIITNITYVGNSPNYVILVIGLTFNNFTFNVNQFTGYINDTKTILNYTFDNNMTIHGINYSNDIWEINLTTEEKNAIDELTQDFL